MLVAFGLLVTMSFRGIAGERTIIVDAAGSGEFRSVQQALDAVRDSQSVSVIIQVRNGVYNEKLFIIRSNVTIVGENRDSTRIVAAVLREEWNAAHNGSDWGAGVVNIDTGVTDVTLANLTVHNNHGSLYGTHNKHQFAIRGAGTRIILLYCNVISDGGDALSLWNKQNGMYYHYNCYFEGWVDFVCPRGWCYITQSRFFGRNLSASIWHDGDADRRQKFVITDSYFDGVPGFPLGRNHRDGQFFLVNCRFSETMTDRPIYHPEGSKSTWRWGARHYFHNCSRDGGNYTWFADNLHLADGAPEPENITAAWAFDGMWDPENTMKPVFPFAFLNTPKDGERNVPSQGVLLKWVPARDSREQIVYLGTTNPPAYVSRQSTSSYHAGPLRRGTTYYWRVDAVTPRGVEAGMIWAFTTQ